jgi:hypothetical protein
MCDACDDADLVFANAAGTWIHPDGFSDSFWRRAKAAKLPRIRFHDLRHTHATLALAAGVHPKVVSERLGHASITITLDTYSHAIPAMQETAASLVASLVFADEAETGPSRSPARSRGCVQPMIALRRRVCPGGIHEGISGL